MRILRRFFRVRWRCVLSTNREILDQLLGDARAHVFDVDHTLLRHSTGRRFAQAGIRTGVFPRRHMIVLPWFYLRYRLGNLTINDLGREVRMLRGLSMTKLADIAEDAWERWGKIDLYPEASAHVRSCVGSGAFTAFASTSLDTILQPLARALGIGDIVASLIEWEGELATGWIASQPCYAEEKARRVISLLETRGIDPAEAAFYSDSFHDLPLLEIVGYPMAVQPDAMLRREARRRRWPIITWQTVRS